MDIDRLIKLYEARDLILQDKIKIEKLLKLYVKEKEQQWKKVFDLRAKPYENVETHETRITIFSVEHLEETWDEFFKRKLSEDYVFSTYKERISYREVALTRIEYEIDKKLEEFKSY